MNPVCEWHGSRLTQTLPEGCPLAIEGGLYPAIHAMQREGYRLMDSVNRLDRDLPRGLELIERHERCYRCSSGLLQYHRPLVERLRMAGAEREHEVIRQQAAPREAICPGISEGGVKRAR